MNTAVGNVSRPATGVEQLEEENRIDEGCMDDPVILNAPNESISSEVAESSTAMSGESVSAGLENSDSDGSLPSGMLANMSPNLMAALGMANEDIPKVETDWKPPE